MVPEGVSVPIEAAIAPSTLHDAVTASPGLPYRHALVPLKLDWSASPLELAHALLETYAELLTALGLPRIPGSAQQTGAYNLLATREWMMLVPRSQDAFDGIAVNALGFAGALLVRNLEQLQLLKTYEPLTLLKNVAFPQP